MTTTQQPSKRLTIIAVLLALIVFNGYIGLSVLALQDNAAVADAPSWLLLPMLHLFATRETAWVWVGQIWPFGNAAVVLAALLRFRTRKTQSSTA